MELGGMIYDIVNWAIHIAAWTFAAWFILTVVYLFLDEGWKRLKSR